MRFGELISYSKKLLRGRRGRTAFICFLPIGTELFFRTAEACIYSLLLYFGKLEPIQLFSGKGWIHPAAALAFTLIRWLTTAPLIYAAAYRLRELCAEKRDLRSVSDILSDRSIFRRSLSALLWSKTIGLAALIPAVFFGVAGFSLIPVSDTPQKLFITAQAFVLAAFSIIFWISAKLSLAAVPFLLNECPELTPFRAVISSFKFMRGRKRLLLKLLAVYVPPMFTILAVPYLLPELMTAFSLSISIYIKEEKYACESAEKGVQHEGA